jgi:hypothetical protein
MLLSDLLPKDKQKEEKRFIEIPRDAATHGRI